MISIDPEIQAYRLFETKIQEICRLNWRFLEYEDRISEAAYIFIIALRTLPTNTGFFWHEYQNVLMDYMQSLKKEYQHQTCWLNLDAPVRSKTINDYNYSLLDLLIAREPDSSEISVHNFLNTLSIQQQNILNLLMDGRSHRSVCMRMKINANDLRQHLQVIGEDYRDYHLGIY